MSIKITSTIPSPKTRSAIIGHLRSLKTLMEKFSRSLFDAAKYPGNLITPGTFNYSLLKYAARLDKEKARLFYSSDEALVHIWKFEEGSNCECITLICYKQ
jgi:hypothetical protein